MCLTHWLEAVLQPHTTSAPPAPVDGWAPGEAPQLGTQGSTELELGTQSSSELGPRGSWEPWIQLGSRRQNQDPECRRLCTFNRAGPKKLQRAQDLGFTAQNAEEKVEAITRLSQEYQGGEYYNWALDYRISSTSTLLLVQMTHSPHFQSCKTSGWVRWGFPKTMVA